ncbi:hypothetical protein FRC02_012189 [Tulasnella sp. 418]|nr:hypothetical protein FRC02_012189 [Tulasnella sp. 418]
MINGPSLSSISLFQCLFSSLLHAFADGGANRVYDALGDDRATYIPDFIKGDFDSIQDYSRNYYNSRNVKIIQDDDQDSTDLMKCIQEIEVIEQNLQLNGTLSSDIRLGVIILGGITGRLDQTIHTLSLLHKLRTQNRKFMVVSEDNVAWVLDSGTHHITLDESILGPNCGLLPVGIDSTILTTQGLRWNLTEAESSFEGMVSTSNAITGPTVQIKTTKPIWWCIEFRKGFLT